MPTNRVNKIDFRRMPYRGILTAIAKESGLSVSSITRAAKRGTPWVLDEIEKKLIEIAKKYESIHAAHMRVENALAA